MDEVVVKMSAWPQSSEGFTRAGECAFKMLYLHVWASQTTQWKRILLSVQEIQEMPVRSLGCEDPLEKEMVTHSSMFAWKTTRTEEPGGYSPWGHKESDMT